MKLPKFLVGIFSAFRARKWLTKDRSQKPNAIFPTTLKRFREARPGTEDFVYSMDKPMRALRERLAVRLTREFPVDKRTDGFAGHTAVGSTFYRLLNASGLGQNPLPIPVVDNAKLIEANGLAKNILPEDIPWLNKLMDLFFGFATPASIYIRKDASTGPPDFTADVKYKKGWTIKALHNVDDFLNLACGGTPELRKWHSEYRSVYLYVIQERQQPNEITLVDGKWVSKSRTAPTPEEARSGNYSGGTVADMSVRDAATGLILPNHFRMRRRDVFNMSGIPNYVMSAIMSCFREVYLDRFSFTYKMRGPEDKRAKSAKYKYVVGCDVKTMDKMIPRWFIEFVCGRLPNYVDERVATFFRRILGAPYVCPAPWTDLQPQDRRLSEYSPSYGGSPYNPTDLNNCVGLPSGCAINPDIGKLWMTFVYTRLLRDVGALTHVGELEPLLRGANPTHALFDMSDDAVILTNDAAVALKVQTPKSPYAKLEPESPLLYLGDVFAISGGERLVVPNPVTFTVNMLSREDSVDKRNPISWANSYLARVALYSTTPVFREMNAIFEEEARKCLGFNPHDLARTMSRLDPDIKTADAMFREDPRVIYYKVDPKDVTPELLNTEISTIGPGDYFEDIKHLFKVPIVPNNEERSTVS